MTRYYRIQPKGLDVNGHYSESSDNEPSSGLHVFCNAYEVCAADVSSETYGDEVVVIEAAHHWSNGDVEGVCVDPDAAKIVGRVSFKMALAYWEKLGRSCGREENFERWLGQNAK